MRRRISTCLVLCFASGAICAQVSDAELRDLTNRLPDNRIVFGNGNELLAAGAQAIRVGRYDDGIMLTEMGLERRGLTDFLRSSALSNLCAAYAGKQEPDRAIEYCSQSLEISTHSWQAWSNRSYAYWLKGMYKEAEGDLQAAMAINPDARQLFVIRGMLNEAGLQPRVITEDHH